MGLDLTLPPTLFEKLNNFYLSEYGYDIHTQLLLYLFNEYNKIKDEPPLEGEDIPYPLIKKVGGNSWVVCVDYSDGEKRSIYVPSWEDAFDVIMEWSKHSFDKHFHKPEQEIVPPVQMDRTNIHISEDRYRVRKRIDGKYLNFGFYTSIEEARIVRDFLVTEDWDSKYSRDNHKDISPQKYTQWLLDTAIKKSGVLV